MSTTASRTGGSRAAHVSSVTATVSRRPSCVSRSAPAPRGSLAKLTPPSTRRVRDRARSEAVPEARVLATRKYAVLQAIGWLSATCFRTSQKPTPSFLKSAQSGLGSSPSGGTRFVQLRGQGGGLGGRRSLLGAEVRPQQPERRRQARPQWCPTRRVRGARTNRLSGPHRHARGGAARQSPATPQPRMPNQRTPMPRPRRSGRPRHPSAPRWHRPSRKSEQRLRCMSRREDGADEPGNTTEPNLQESSTLGLRTWPRFCLSATVRSRGCA